MCKDAARRVASGAMRQGSWVNCLGRTGLNIAEKKLISVPNLSQGQEELPDVTQEPFVNQKDWRRGSTDDLRVAKPLQFSRKKGLLLVGQPLVFSVS